MAADRQQEEPVAHHTSSTPATANGQQLASPMIKLAADAGVHHFDMDAPPKHKMLLEDIPPSQQLNLRFERICAYVNTDYDTPGMVTRLKRAVNQQARAEAEAKQKKQILFSVTGEMLPGEMLALMGPSGSGKTSLLSIISGRAPKAVITSGKVTSNGARFTKAAKRRVGFVLQDDLLYESLTVWETLGYAAALRLPRGMSAAQRAERVEAVLLALGLTKCRHTIIGGFFRRGISGGERKRVSIGHELLINPAILMLDEPTSGLDSTTALHLLVTLRQLALGGRAIATTIHQPSSRLYQQLDKLMLLAEGHVMYYGKADQVVSWFGTLGFAMPYGVNVADFLLDLAQGEVEGGDFTRLTTAAAAGQQQVYKQQQALQLTADGEDAQQQDRQAKQQQQQSGTAQGVPAAPLSGPAAIQALYSSYETYKRKHPGGFGGEPGQVADLQLALEPPVSRRAAAGDSKRRLGSSVGNGSLIERSLQKAGSFLGLADLGGDKADADSPKQQQQQQGKGVAGAAGISDSDELSDPVEEYDTGDAPEYQRSITRIWSRSRSSSNLFGGGPGDVEAGCCGVVGAPGCAGQLVGSMGLADRGGASYSTQLRVLLQRHIKVKRFESLSSQRFLQGIIVALITGMFWWQRGKGGSLLAASDVVGLLFFELLFPAFTALFTSLFTFPNDYRMLLKERASGMYRVSAFYLSSAISDLPMDCALPALFVVIIYFMGGLRLTATAFLSNLTALVLNVLVAQSMGLLLGVAFMNPKTAQTVASIIMLGFMLVGGYYVRGIPAWISWIRYLSFVYWGFNLLLKIEFAGATYYSCGSSGLGTLDASSAAGPAAAPCHAVPDLQAALQLPTNPNQSPALEVGVLFAMLVLLRLMVYYTLRQKTKAA